MLRISQSAHAEVSLRKDGRDKVRGGEVVRGVGEERRRGKVVREGSAHAVVGAEHERDLRSLPAPIRTRAHVARPAACAASPHARRGTSQ